MRCGGAVPVMVSHSAARWRGLVRFSWLGPTFSNAWIGMIVIFVGGIIAFGEQGVKKGIESIAPGLFNEDNKETLETRIERLTNSLGDSAKTISDIEREIESRKTLVTKLQHDADVAKQIGELKAEQVAAVSQALRGESNRESQSGFWVNVGTNLFFTLLGAALAEGIRWWRERSL
jgi:hypothetical protein